MLLFFKYLNSYVDGNFSSYFELVGSLHSLRSSSNGTLLKLPRVKTTALQSSYFYRLVRLWNSLPREIREASSVFSFLDLLSKWPPLPYSLGKGGQRIGQRGPSPPCYFIIFLIHKCVHWSKPDKTDEKPFIWCIWWHALLDIILSNILNTFVHWD